MFPFHARIPELRHDYELRAADSVNDSLEPDLGAAPTTPTAVGFMAASFSPRGDFDAQPTWPLSFVLITFRASILDADLVLNSGSARAVAKS